MLANLVYKSRRERTAAGIWKVVSRQVERWTHKKCKRSQDNFPSAWNLKKKRKIMRNENGHKITNTHFTWKGLDQKWSFTLIKTTRETLFSSPFSCSTMNANLNPTKMVNPWLSYDNAQNVASDMPVFIVLELAYSKTTLRLSNLDFHKLRCTYIQLQLV